MRAKVKVVPPAPDSLARLRETWRAVALVPEPEESCCARLVARTDVPSQDEAKEWLTFLRGLGLVNEGERGYHRLREDPEEIDLAGRFQAGVYGVDALLERLETDPADPTDADAAFDRFEDRVPNWERHHNADWESVWRERVARLLAWATLLGLVEHVDGGYVRAD